TALGEAGPTSLPHAGQNAVPLLARLIDRLAAYEPRRRTTPATAAALDVLAGGAGKLGERLGQAGPLPPTPRGPRQAAQSTTVAPTRLEGSTALNAMPGRASVECDCRPVAGTSIDDLRGELAEALGDGIPYEIAYPEPLTGGSISPFETPLADACREWFDR